MDNKTDETNKVSLPSANDETEPTTILEAQRLGIVSQLMFKQQQEEERQQAQAASDKPQTSSLEEITLKAAVQRPDDKISERECDKVISEDKSVSDKETDSDKSEIKTDVPLKKEEVKVQEEAKEEEEEEEEEDEEDEEEDEESEKQSIQLAVNKQQETPPDLLESVALKEKNKQDTIAYETLLDEEDDEIEENVSVTEVVQEKPIEKEMENEEEKPNENIEEKPTDLEEEQIKVNTNSENIEALGIETIVANVEEQSPSLLLSSSEMSSSALPHNNNELECVSPEAITHPTNDEAMDKPPIPIQTYLWEDVKRAKEQGGYPWTHLYKEPLGPDDEPEIILKYKSSPKVYRSGSKTDADYAEDTPKSQKKVRIQEEVEIKETDNYIQDLELESSNDELEQEDPVAEKSPTPGSEKVIDPDVKLSPKSILKRKKNDIIQGASSKTSKIVENSAKLAKKVQPFVVKIKNMADKQISKVTHHSKNKTGPSTSPNANLSSNSNNNSNSIRTIPLTSPNDIILQDETKILTLRESPKQRNPDLISYVVKQDSDDIIDLVALDESPNEIRKRREHLSSENEDTIIVPDEIIELPKRILDETNERILQVPTNSHIETDVDADYNNNRINVNEDVDTDSVEPTIEEILIEQNRETPDVVPVKAPRKKKEHVYEDIDDDDMDLEVKLITESRDMSFTNDPKLKRQEHIDGFDPVIVDMLGNEGIKISLQLQDDQVLDDLRKSERPLEKIVAQTSEDEKPLGSHNLLAPISSIDSTSSDEDAKRQLSIVVEESDDDSSRLKKTLSEETDATGNEADDEAGIPDEAASVKEDDTLIDDNLPEANIKEDIVVPETQNDASATNTNIAVDGRWSKMGDHEYEPIGVPMDEAETKEKKGAVGGALDADNLPSTMYDLNDQKLLRVPSSDNDDQLSVQEMQQQIEDKYFSGSSSLPSTLEKKKNVIPMAKAASEELEDEAVEVLPKKSYMSQAQDHRRALQQKLSTQAGRLRSRLSNMKTKRKAKITRKSESPRGGSPKGGSLKTDSPLRDSFDRESPQRVSPKRESPKHSPKAKLRKRFKAPEFAKFKNIHMPKITKPDFKRPEMPSMPKFKKPEFKKPELPKMLTERPHFNKPDFSKFKMPEKFSTLKLRRSKSLKEPDVPTTSSVADSLDDSSRSRSKTPKKRFDIDFKTYPRIFGKFKKQKLEPNSVRSVRDDTPPPVEFATVPRSALVKGPTSRWTDRSSEVEEIAPVDNESGKYQQFGSETDFDHEGSLERRMRGNIDRYSSEQEFQENEERKQLEEYDKENREIHELTEAKQLEARGRKPQLEKQDSDLASEEEKQFWASPLGQQIRNNYDLNSNEIDNLSYNIDQYLNANKDINRSSTPHTNQETQSSGSSENRHRKGVLEEIDDDEFFLRKKGISEDNIRIGEYISGAIREGLGTPVNNTLRQMDSQYDAYYDEDISDRMDAEYTPEKPTRRQQKKESFDSEEQAQDESFTERAADYYNTFPPNRPTRKQKKQDEQDQQVPYAEDDDYQLDDEVDEDEKLNDNSFYENDHMMGIEQPNILITNDDYKYDKEFKYENDLELIKRVPPTPPTRRRKKHFREVTPFDHILSGRSASNNFIAETNDNNIIVYRTEHEYIAPVAQEQQFAAAPPPMPIPRRSRSRSRSQLITDDDRTSRGAESFVFGSNEPAEEPTFTIDMQETNGYAVVKKDLPPRPPAPLRRKRSTRSGSAGDRQFFTLPNKKTEEEPIRPVRNYSTISPSRPMRPPRRSASNSLADINKQETQSQDATEYEEIDDGIDESETHSKLQSGEILSKMKDRPLPPPPRPPRDTNKRNKKHSDDKHDKDDGAEGVVILESVPQPERRGISIENNALNLAANEIDETDNATQTDIFDDEEDYDLNLDNSSRVKTLQDILKEEQAAEIERARQLADAESLSRGIQKFRTTNQRSFSERSRTSNDRPKTPTSRPITPAAIVIERKISKPPSRTSINETNVEETITASLVVQPIEITDSHSQQPEENKDLNIDNEESQEEENIIDNLDQHITQQKLTDQKSFETEKDDVDLGNANIESDYYKTDLAPEDIPLVLDLAEELVDEVLEVALAETAPPTAPPRRKSSAVIEQIADVEPEPELEPLEPIEETLTSNRLHLSNLEIDRLSVNSLQAGKIIVSELDSLTIRTQELDCPPGNINSSIQLPPGLIEEIVERIRASERESLQQQQREEQEAQKKKDDEQANKDSQKGETENTKDEEKAPARPPPPQPTAIPPQQHPQFVFPEYPFSVIPPSFYQLRNYSEEEQMPPQSQQTANRRRRQQRKRDSTSEEEFQRDQRNRSRHDHDTRSPEPTVSELGGRLVRACGSAISRTGRNVINMIRAGNKEENRKDVHIALVILLIILGTLIMIGTRDTNAVHHHHWDYFNPPENGGRPI